MEQFHSSDIRNFAIVGHGASGKTSLAEAILMLGGAINRLGTIEDGSTVSDYHPAEKARKISIHSTPLHIEWENKKFNIIIADDNSITIDTAAGGIAVTDDGGSFYNPETREITLNYSFDFNGTSYVARDVLEFRNRVVDGVNQFNI